MYEDVHINQIQLEKYTAGDGGGLYVQQKGTLKKDSLFLVDKATKIKHLYLKVDTLIQLKT